ncbi:MAG: ARMT1-like domain-containing protein [Methanothrix sp.]|nr:ARMT1-like domain-containing protein [Methanothrix sp.]
MVLILPSDMTSLSEEDVMLNIREFLCNDSDDKSYLRIISSPAFEPESFTIGDREKEPLFLNESERKFQTWCENLIKDQLLRMAESENLVFNDIQDIIIIIWRNAERLLNYEHKGNKLKNCIWNQEFIDIIDKVIIFSLFGNFETKYATHKKFRDISRKIMPIIIKRVSEDRLELKDYLKLSIISGISGLDLKGSNAASSFISHGGIPMALYYNMEPVEAAERYYHDLTSRLNSPTPIFEWDYFLEQIKMSNIKLVWSTDDYIETFFDLLFINYLLKKYNNISITVIPKRETYGNDTSYSDILEMLKLCENEYDVIQKLLKDGKRFNINRCGPSMGAVNIKKLSNEVVDLIDQSNLVVIKGCRAHEMVQGSLNKISYSMYVVAREFSESVTGYDAREMPLLFFHLPPGGYAFKGFKNRNLREEVFKDGKKIFLSEVTLKDNFITGPNSYTRDEPNNPKISKN